MKGHVLGLLLICLTGGLRPVHAAQEDSLYHRAFSALHARGQFNGAVLIAKDGKILLDAYFGDADKSEQKPLSASSLYRLASVSKTMTASAVLSLVDAGKLGLDDTVRRFLPSFPYPGITIRHLLQHSSGLPEYIFGVGDYWKGRTQWMTNRDVLQWIVDTHPALAFPEGTGWEYCNTGYALLPLIIEAVTGESYASYLRRAVLVPAGMTNTFHISELGPREVERVARGHGFDYATGTDVRADRHAILAAEFKADSVYGAGDIFSTPRDLFVFDQALRAGKVVTPGLQQVAYTSMLLPEGLPAGYGLGWQVAASEFTGRIIHHHGQGDGYRTRYYRFLDRGITIVTLQNARNNYADDAIRLAQSLAFKGTYSLPAHSLAEALSEVMHRAGIDSTLDLVARAAAAPDPWIMNERDLNNLAFTYWYRDERETAVRLLRGYLVLAPDFPNGYATLAEALGDMGRAAESRACYEKALEVAQKNPKAFARNIVALKKQLAKP